MKIDVYEHYLVAMCLYKPKYINSVPLEIIIKPQFKEILTLAKELKSDDDLPISSIVLKELVKNNGKEATPNDVGLMYEIIKKEIIKYNDYELDNEFNSILQMLIKRKDQINVINTLYKSINLIENGNELEGIINAKSISYTGALSIPDTIELLDNSIDNTNIFLTGIKSIDKNTMGFAKGNLLTLAGDTGSMKTMITLWMCLKILEANENFTCIYFEKEMPIKDIARRIASYITQIDTLTLMDNEYKAENKLLIRDKIEKDPKIKNLLDRLILVPNTNFSNAEHIYAYISKYKADIWCLDFLTQLGADTVSTDFNRHTMIQAALLKNIIADTDSFGIVITQIKKNSSRQRSNKIPQIDDIEWSGSISQYSAYIFSTFYPYYYYPNVIKEYYFLQGLKNRHSSIFVVPLIAYPQFSSFNEPDEITKNDMRNWYSNYVNRFRGYNG